MRNQAMQKEIIIYNIQIQKKKKINTKENLKEIVEGQLIILKRLQELSGLNDSS